MLSCKPQYLPTQHSLDLQVSLDGHTFATGQFPPSMRPEQHVSFSRLHPCIFLMAIP